MNPFRRNRASETGQGSGSASQVPIPKPFTLKTKSSNSVTLVEGTDNETLKVATSKARPEFELRQDPTYPAVPVAPVSSPVQEMSTAATVVEGPVGEAVPSASPQMAPKVTARSESSNGAAAAAPKPSQEVAATAPGDGEVVGVSATSRPKRLSSDVKPVISVRDVKKLYQMGDIEVQALRGINLDIYPGEIMAIMGPSGSGKSTLMNVLGCLDVPSEGVYMLDGVDVRKLSDNQLAAIRSRKIGFVFQSYNLLARTTALANVELPLLYSGISGRERRKRAKESLSLVGLGERLDHRPNELSGGQQQRVAIARALINRPAMILADEPTGNLDSKTRVEIMKLFQRLNRDQGITIVFVTHDPETADYCERVVWIRDGVIAKDQRHKIRAGIYAADHALSEPEAVEPASNPNDLSENEVAVEVAPQPAEADPIVPVPIPVAKEEVVPVQVINESAAPDKVELPLL
ncbi:MAG: ATP-binding cassette domain-containing protein [Caldilineaceae bacterium]